MQIAVGNPEKIVHVFIPQDAKKIGVLLSGGSDSAILLYMLALESKQQNVEVIPFTVPRTDGAITYSPKIVEIVNQLTDSNLQRPIQVGDGINLHHSQQAQSGGREIYYRYKDIEYHYYGSQQIPEELQNLPDIIYPYRPNALFNPGNAICPFFNLTKEHTLDLYYKLKVPELLKYTHSCCVLDLGRCNKCYNCIERKWAFEKIGQTDIGSL